MSAVSARQAGREAAARAVEKGTLSLLKAKPSARASLLSPPRAGLADVSNCYGCVLQAHQRGATERGAHRRACGAARPNSRAEPLRRTVGTAAAPPAGGVAAANATR